MCRHAELIHRSFRIALAGAFVLLVGCGSDSPTATSTVSSQPPAPIPTQSPRTLTVQLIANNDPVKATVTIDIKGYGYTMTVTAEGLTPNSRHIINMHGGTTCAIQDAVPSRLTNVDHLTADAKGMLTSVTTWPTAYSISPGGRILTVHGNDATDGYLGHIACADMPS